MTNENSSAKLGGSDERQLIRVCAPSAHAGIGDALRRAFATTPVTNDDRELLTLLERF